MARRILTILLIVLSSILLLLSVAGIGTIWIYNRPLKRVVEMRVQEIDSTLAQIDHDLLTAKSEVERALRIIEAAETGLQSLTEKTQDASQVLANVSSSLDEKVIPRLKTTRAQLETVRGTLEQLRAALGQVNTIPFLDIKLPGDDFFASLIQEVDSLDTEIANMQNLAEKTSTFVSDSSFLLGGDFNETKQHLQELLYVLEGYDAQITDWRMQLARIGGAAPHWIDNASIILTIFLLWFGFSQFGLLLHGLNLRQGGDPLVVLRRPQTLESFEVEEIDEIVD